MIPNSLPRISSAKNNLETNFAQLEEILFKSFQTSMRVNQEVRRATTIQFLRSQVQGYDWKIYQNVGKTNGLSFICNAKLIAKADQCTCSQEPQLKKPLKVHDGGRAHEHQPTSS